MARIYREMTEESASLPVESYRSETKKKYFGKIVVQKSENTVTNKTFVTLTSAVPLFDNTEQKNNLISELISAFAFFGKKYNLPPDAKILAVGLGNDKITADSLGSRVVEKLFVTSHLYSEMGMRIRYGNLCTLKTSVSGVTGIESFDLLSATIRTVKPDLVVAIDTLSCGKSERLGCTIQLTDNGIEPGTGVGNAKKKMSHESLKVPVLALGVPFVIYVRTLLTEHGITKTDSPLSSLVVTAKDIDFLIEDYSDVIAHAINKWVHET